MDLPDINGKNVLIIGCPASGKTYLSNLLESSTHQTFHTDDYINHGYYESMYKCLSDVIECDKLTIVEGVQGYRMLRKGVEMDNYYPDLVIELRITQRRMLLTYSIERNPKKIKYLKAFNKTHNKILSDYRAMNNKHKPEWLVINNNY